MDFSNKFTWGDGRGGGVGFLGHGRMGVRGCGGGEVQARGRGGALTWQLKRRTEISRGSAINELG